MGRHRRVSGAGAAPEEALIEAAGVCIEARRIGPLAAGALALRPGVATAGAGVPAPRASRHVALVRERAAPVGGRIVSAHRRAINLLLETDSVVTLLPEATPLHPWAVTIRFEDVFHAGSPFLAAGSMVRAGDGVLAAGALRIALAGAEVVDLSLRLRPAVAPPAGTARLESLKSAATDAAFDAVLFEALESFRAGGEARDLVSLLGLGPGLTPSGDDVLVGVLAGLDAMCTAKPDAPAQRAALAAALASRPEQGTTRLSAQMLAAAAQGLYAEPVLRMLEALSKDAAASLAASSQLSCMGHRSGIDTLRGIVAVLERP